MRTRQENLVIARWLADRGTTPKKSKVGSRRGPYRRKNGLNDFEIVSDVYGVSVWAVKQALKTREMYPNNRLVQHYDSLQELKKQHLQGFKNTHTKKKVA